MRNGNLLMRSGAPANRFGAYQKVFQRVAGLIHILDSAR